MTSWIRRRTTRKCRPLVSLEKTIAQATPLNIYPMCLHNVFWRGARSVLKGCAICCRIGFERGGRSVLILAKRGGLQTDEPSLKPSYRHKPPQTLELNVRL